jgi:hypothetical protein
VLRELMRHGHRVQRSRRHSQTMASIELLPSGTHSTVVPLNRDSSVGLESTVGDPSERADVQYQVDNMLLQEIFWNGFPQWICQAHKLSSALYPFHRPASTMRVNGNDVEAWSN